MPGTLDSTMQSADREMEPIIGSRRQRAARFERDVLPHLDRVYCAALCLADDQAQAGELVQETFARAYAAFGQMPPETDMTALLYRILISTHASSRRSRRVPGPAPARGTRSRAGHADREGGSPAEITAVLRLPGPVVKGALRQLQPDFRLVVYLADVENLACREIAGIMTAPVGTVILRLHRGRRQLRELLRDHAAEQPDHNEALARSGCKDREQDGGVTFARTRTAAVETDLSAVHLLTPRTLAMNPGHEEGDDSEASPNSETKDPAQAPLARGPSGRSARPRCRPG